MRLFTIGCLKNLLLTALCVPLLLQAQILPQEILMIKKSGFFSFELETTVYKPVGDGPFPLVVINHGKAAGDPKFQNRSTYPLAARYFLPPSLT
jgi:hypothetical protein